MASDAATIIGLGIGIGILAIAIWLASVQHHRQTRIQHQYEASLLSTQRANERIERQIELSEQQIELSQRNTELWERQVDALENMARRQEEMLQVLRQLVDPRRGTAEGIEDRDSIMKLP